MVFSSYYLFSDLSSCYYLLVTTYYNFILFSENSANSQSERQTTEELAQPFATASNKVLEESSRKGNTSSLPVFDASFILAATNNFALSNKLGEGGFGTVYRVILCPYIIFFLINYFASNSVYKVALKLNHKFTSTTAPCELYSTSCIALPNYLSILVPKIY